jgi:hypothetical protein
MAHVWTVMFSIMALLYLLLFASVGRYYSGAA